MVLAASAAFGKKTLRTELLVVPGHSRSCKAQRQSQARLRVQQIWPRQKPCASKSSGEHFSVPAETRD